MSENRTRKYYFTTRDLLYIALLSALGGVASAYIGYVGSTFGSLTGVPMGGQLISGLHVFWIILAMALIDKKGAGALTGTVKGFVEFVTGSHLGILVLPTSLLEGIFAEIGFWPFKKYRTVAFLVAGGLGSWANLLVTNTLFNAFPGIQMFGTLSIMAFASGVVFAGYLGSGIVQSLADAGIVRLPAYARKSRAYSVLGALAVILGAGVVVVFALHYLIPGQNLVSTSDNNMDPIVGATPYMQITGLVAHPGTIDARDYQPEFVTINAVNRRGGNHAYNFTGVPLGLVLTDAGIEANATTMDIAGADRYAQTFNVSEVLGDSTYILVPENNEIDLVSKNTTSHYWVRGIATINVY